MPIIEIDRMELEGHYIALREAAEGRGAYKLAAELAIDYLFDVLGEPGAGE